MGAQFTQTRVIGENYLKTANLEYGTLNISSIDLPKINLQEIDDQYYNSGAEMLIVAPNNPDFVKAIEPLAEWKNQKGVKTLIASNFSLYEGEDTAEKIRNMIKDFYSNGNLKWVLLAADAQDNLIPTRYVYNPDTVRYEQAESVGDLHQKPTDYYYADLTGDWDEDGDGQYGESAMDNDNGIDEISWIPEVYVGRLPANDATELEIMVNKTINYEKEPLMGNWMNRMLFGAGISDQKTDKDPDGEDEARLSHFIWENYFPSDMESMHLTQTTDFYPAGVLQELSHSSFTSEFDGGYSAVFAAGHGNYRLINDKLETFFTNDDAKNAGNQYMPSLFYADACTTAPFDLNRYDNNLGETLIKVEDAGAIGYIGALRVTWYFQDDLELESLNRGNARFFFKEFFENEKYQQGKALYDSKVSYLQSEYFTQGDGSIIYDYERKNLLTYNLLGDPETDIYTNIPNKAANPFQEQYYAGSKINLTVKDSLGNLVPYARINLQTNDGKFYTFYSDKNGYAETRLHYDANENYTATVSGHNLIPTQFNFTTVKENETPNISEFSWTPKDPKISENLCFNISVEDNITGVESAFVLISKNNFNTFQYFTFTQDSGTEKNDYSCLTDKFDSGQYTFIVIARDYANNVNIYFEDSFSFSVPISPMQIFLMIIGFSVIGMLGLSTFIVYKNLNIFGEFSKKGILKDFLAEVPGDQYDNIKIKLNNELSSLEELQIKKVLQNTLNESEKLILQENYDKARQRLLEFKNSIPKEKFNLIKRQVNKKLKSIQKRMIKKTILELGTKFGRLQIIEITEKTGEKEEIIIDTVKEMIKNEEIYGEFFESSQSVAFNQQANINEIDDLLSSFKDWEGEGRGKKE